MSNPLKYGLLPLHQFLRLVFLSHSYTLHIHTERKPQREGNCWGKIRFTDNYQAWHREHRCLLLDAACIFQQSPCSALSVSRMSVSKPGSIWASLPWACGVGCRSSARSLLHPCRYWTSCIYTALFKVWQWGYFLFISDGAILADYLYQLTTFLRWIWQFFRWGHLWSAAG